MKKNLSSIFCLLLMAFCFMFAACNGCSNKPVEPIEPQGYNYDEVVVADYDYIASQYGAPEGFYFYECQVVLDTTLDAMTEPVIVAMRNIFQHADTCIAIQHEPGCYDQAPDTVYVNDYWAGDQEISARNAIMWKELMKIIEPYRPMLNTRYITLRRIMAPPFPENGWYLFGNKNGNPLIAVDAATGDVYKAEELKSVEGPNFRLGTPLGEWP